LKASTSGITKAVTAKPAQEEDFKEFRKRKRQNTTQSTPTSKKAAAAVGNTPTNKVTIRNYLAPLRATTMDVDTTGAGVTTLEEKAPGKAGRTSPIILTSTVKLIQLQRQLKNVAKGAFVFRSTRNGTKVITKILADFDVAKSYLFNNNLSFTPSFRSHRSL
jgi:hypothetical protein